MSISLPISFEHDRQICKFGIGNWTPLTKPVLWQPLCLITVHIDLISIFYVNEAPHRQTQDSAVSIHKHHQSLHATTPTLNPNMVRKSLGIHHGFYHLASYKVTAYMLACQLPCCKAPGAFNCLCTPWS